MQLSERIEIDRAKDMVWAVITDIESCSKWLGNVKTIEVIDQPSSGLVGFKWKETRDFCGKEASEIMWITESTENEFYCTRAESHGSVYVSKLSLSESNGVTVLTMSFKAKPQTFMARVLSRLMSKIIASSLSKGVQKDLSDIKHYVER